MEMLKPLLKAMTKHGMGSVGKYIITPKTFLFVENQLREKLSLEFV
jgi:hypothetical protein